jgi:hypothetical protein
MPCPEAFSLARGLLFPSGIERKTLAFRLEPRLTLKQVFELFQISIRV